MAKRYENGPSRVTDRLMLNSDLRILYCIGLYRAVLVTIFYVHTKYCLVPIINNDHSASAQSYTEHCDSWKFNRPHTKVVKCKVTCT